MPQVFIGESFSADTWIEARGMWGAGEEWLQLEKIGRRPLSLNARSINKSPKEETRSVTRDVTVGGG